MKSHPSLRSETCAAKLRTMVREAMESAHQALDCHEREILSLRCGLATGKRRSIQETSSILGLGVSQVEKLEESARRKAFSDPIGNLFKQSAVRIARYHDLGETEGQADLEVALILLRQSYRLADALSFVMREPGEMPTDVPQD